jgi:RNA polymerase sigma-70 factor (ECF subfamily)
VAILHFASHAVVDPAGLRGTALLLAPGGGDDGVVRPEELSALSLDADLVVLSACATAVSGGHAGDEGVRGLVAPLIEAGARGVAATLWAVDDEAQRVLMRRLYQRLARGETTAAAIRGAKLDAMREGASPRDWAALVLWHPPRMSSVIHADSVSRALESVMRRYSGVLRTVGARYRLPSADLDELAQEVRVRLWGALSTNERIDAVSPSYLYRAATTAAIDIVRRRRTARGDSLDLVDDAEVSARRAPPTPERDASVRELGERIEEALQSITASRRPVVRMYLAGYGTTEIGELMGWTEAKARNLVYRGLADLRVRLRAMGIDGEGTAE